MILVLCPGDRDAAAEVVCAALQRSCGASQARRIGPALWQARERAGEPAGRILLAIDPPAQWAGLLIDAIRRGRHKLLLFGSLPAELAAFLGARPAEPPAGWAADAASAPAPSGADARSLLQIDYRASRPRPWLRPPIAVRPLLRYDFTDEWNNLGYGAVRCDGDLWSVAQPLRWSRDDSLATLGLPGRELFDYAACRDDRVLWFNRPVGPVDSAEWRIVEDFLAHAGAPALPCQPVLSEVPAGHAAAATMRLDCDEDIESARELWRLYWRLRVPFSLALHARIIQEGMSTALARDVLDGGGSLLSHTATHAPDWGGSYEAALREALVSAEVIEQATGQRVRYAVSPFHQTPRYARAALADAGYAGCVGGIIRNDPDFLMARAGPAPGSPQGFIGHSQQCMLHGDCMLRDGDPLRVFREAFDIARAAGTLFGWLDHPFSARYQYGWTDEAQRMRAHEDFITALREAEPRLLLLSEDDALDFLGDRARVRVHEQDGRFAVLPPEARNSTLNPVLRHAGGEHELGPGGLLL